MSDSDDWEANCDDDVLDQKLESKANENFQKEDDYDSDEERKKMKEEEKKIREAHIPR